MSFVFPIMLLLILVCYIFLLLLVYSSREASDRATNIQRSCQRDLENCRECLIQIRADKEAEEEKVENLTRELTRLQKCLVELVGHTQDSEDDK